MSAMKEFTPMRAEEKQKITNLDDVFTLLDVGYWTWLYFFTAALTPVAEVINLMGVEFMVPPMNFTCADRPVTRGPRVGGNECFVSPEGTGQTCQNFEYDHSTYLSTVTSEFDLVCSRAHLLHWYRVIFTVGCIMGSPLGGIISDKYGRLPTIWYGTMINFTLTLLNFILSDFRALIVVRLLLGIFTNFTISPAYTLGIEVCPLKYRWIYGVLIALPYAITLIAMAGISYLYKTWLAIQASALIPLIVLLLLCNPWVLDESPRWLVARGELKEAEQILTHAATLNKKKNIFPKKLRLVLKQITENAGGKQSSRPVLLWDRIKSLFGSKVMGKISLITLTIWFFQSCLYISIPLRAHVFRSPFIYMAALGLAEIPAYTITAPITKKYGRKKVVIICLGLTAFLELVLAAFEGFHSERDVMKSIISAMAYTFVCSFYQINVMYSTELFPTSVRTLGTSLCYLMSSIGWNLPVLMENILPPEFSWICLVVYSGMAFIAVSLINFLPETNSMPLMQTVQEFEDYLRSRENVENATLEGYTVIENTYVPEYIPGVKNL